MRVTLIGIVKRKTLRLRTTINTSGTFLQADCKAETFLSGERGKIRIEKCLIYCQMSRILRVKAIYLHFYAFMHSHSLRV